MTRRRLTTQKERDTAVAGGCLILLMLPVVFLVRGLIVLFVWNIGVVPIVYEAGGHVGGISLWGAIAIGFGLGLLRSIIAPRTQVKSA